MKNIDKSKLVLANSEDFVITDKPLETKQIGYYKDAWNRFKKNKVSLVAFVIICIIMFFIVFGPYMKRYSEPKNKSDGIKIGYLTPRVKILEKLGIFDGTKKIEMPKNFVIKLAKDPRAKGIILSGVPKELLDDDFSNDKKYENVDDLKIKVDYYRYIDFINSYYDKVDGIVKLNSIVGHSDHGKGKVISISPDKTIVKFENLDTPVEFDKDQSKKLFVLDPPTLHTTIKTLNEEQYNDALSKNLIVELLSITDGNYIVKVKFFNFVLNQDAADTYFWFGTDGEGRDLFLTLWNGARISLLMALSIVIINAIIGLTIGSISGYYGGKFDLLFDRFVEILGGIPFMAVLTLLIIRFGTTLPVIVLAFTLTGWIGSYAMARMQFYRFKNREYILAARTLGAKDSRIMFRHIFPNALGYMVTTFALAIPSFIFSEASFSYLGIINYQNAISIGILLEQGQRVMSVHPHTLIFPALYISILMITFNLFGNGLRDAFNPSLRGAE